LLLLVAAAPARAGDRTAARNAWKQATRHYELGEFDKALEAFKEAYRNVPDPVLLFDLGQCYRQLGEVHEALRSYRVYLLKTPETPHSDEVRGLIDRLQKTHAPPPADPQAAPPPPPATGLSPPRLTPPAPLLPPP